MPYMACDLGPDWTGQDGWNKWWALMTRLLGVDLWVRFFDGKICMEN